MKMSFHLLANKARFHVKGYAPGLALKISPKAIWK